MSLLRTLYSKFGKSYSDLERKQFEYKHQLTVKTKAQDVDIDATVHAADKNTLEGTVKAVYKNKDLGEVEAKYQTEGPLDVSFKMDKYWPSTHLIAKVKQDFLPRLSVDYFSNTFNASAQADLLSHKPSVEVSGVYGSEGALFGGSAVFDLKDSQVSNYNVAFEYGTPEFVATVQTLDRGERLQLSYFHSFLGKHQLPCAVGAGAEINLASFDGRVLTLVGERQIPSNATVRAKMDTRGSLAVAFERRLDSGVRFNVASQWNLLKRSSAPDRIGFGLTLGEN